MSEIEENCFDNYYYKLKELTIPETVKTIPKKCIEDCRYLTNITIPLNESQMIIGNKIFKNQSHFKGEEDIVLSNLIKIINGKEVDGSTITIPSHDIIFLSLMTALLISPIRLPST